MREAKSRHDMDTTGVKIEIISLCIFTEFLKKLYKYPQWDSTGDSDVDDTVMLVTL